MYSAKIYGSESQMTFALFQESNAKEDWTEYILRHSNVRHPNILQIFGVARSASVYAVLAHNELSPYKHFLEIHCLSPIMNVYMHYRWAMEEDDAQHYMDPIIGYVPPHAQTLWIDRCSGRLCIELAPILFAGPYLDMTDTLGRNPDYSIEFDHPNAEHKVIACLEVDQYHAICTSMLMRIREISIPVSMEVNLGAIARLPSGYQSSELLEIACIDALGLYGRVDKQIVDGGWTRFYCRSSELQEDNVLCQWSIKLPHQWCWLSQAHHIFKTLDIVSDHDSYVTVRGVRFELEIPPLPTHTREGYLFVCPPKDFQTGPHSFRWPDSPWYWSLDPTGMDVLSAWQALRLGFPPITINTTLFTSSWDTAVYGGLSQFHSAKGFDPESQDLALHLGEPLYCLVAPPAFVRAQGHPRSGEVECSFTDVAVETAAANPPELPTGGDALSPRQPPVMLMPESLVPGPSLFIEEFCSMYDLGEEVLARFQAHRFKRTNGFAFVELADLTKMGFLTGEIAEIKAAISTWAKRT
ncbi:hypothetical protein FB45DRAFT_934339 [Roridomyces roridus]|uniref:Protein kinase domain-containing protein n=1 Tax=Roridomyces roridus TaxID=1738132 RepID=A0AAD7BC29_9AGAR|nr:hypothetical protein FB45DRAFT_934339 [Roridomyces roridus]